MAASAYFDTVQKLYIAFYQRPADSAGLKYWAEQIDAANGNIDAAIQAFSTQEEAVELYGEIDETTIESVLDSIYFAAFGRSPEQEELDYWVPEFVAGRVTPSNIALAVVLGALGTDAATIDNKLVVANEFTAQTDGRDPTDPAFGTAPFAATYDGYDDVAAARDLLSGVTDDPDTIPSPEDITTAIVDTIADEGDPIIPQEPTPTFSLTADAASVDEGDTVTFTVEGGKANFTYNYELTGVDATDVEGGVLTGTVTTDADGNGTFEVTLANDRTTDGADTLVATLPNTGLSASVTVNDTSTDNIAPVAEDATGATTEAGAVVTGQLVATDAEDDAVTFALDAEVEGLTLNADGTYSFDPSLNSAAQALIYKDSPLDVVANYTVTDALGATDTGTITITVTPKPLTFTLTADKASAEEGATTVYTVTASEDLVDATDVVFTLVPGDGLAANAGTATTNTADFATGAFNPTTVTIAAGAKTATFNVVAVNDANTELQESYSVKAEVAGVTEPLTLGGKVVDATGAGGVGQTFTLTTGVDTMPGLVGSANSTGTDGNDTIVGLVDKATPTNTTLNPLDVINGGLGTNSMTLNFVGNGTDGDDANELQAIPAGVTISNIQTLNLRAAGDVGIKGGASLDLSSQTFNTINVTTGDDVAIKAATTADVSYKDLTGALTIDGGKTITVTDSTADKNITIGDTTESAGSVTVTDSKQGTGIITVEGGTDVTVTATVAGTAADVVGGKIDVGNGGDLPTGAIKVTQNNTNTGAANTNAPIAEVQTIKVTSADTGDLGTETVTITLDSDGDGVGDDAVVVDLTSINVTDVHVLADAIAAAIDVKSYVTAVTDHVDEVTLTYTAGLNYAEAAQTANVAFDGALTFGTTKNGAATGGADFADVTAGAINVKGGTSIDITVNSTSTAAAETADGDITNGTVTAMAGAATTTISVVQNNTATTQTKAAVAATAGTSTVTFKDLAKDATVTVAGLTFTAAKNLTAAEVAQAFADLTAVDTQSNGVTANGIYTGDVDANITSGSANGAVVVFTNTAGTAAPTLALASSAGASLPTKVDAVGSAGSAVDTSDNTVTAGAVVLDDNATAASVTDITITNFNTATLGGTNGFDKLANLSLTNNTGAITLDTAGTSLTMNVNDIVSTVNIDVNGASVTNLTINTSGAKSDFDLTAAAVTDLKVAGDQALVLTGSTLTALKNLTVTGAGGVVIAQTTEADTLESVDASGSSGAVTVGIAANKSTYKGSSGVDTVTLTDAAIDKSIALNDGDDTLTLLAGATAIPSSKVDGGNGDDTISMDRASAAGLDGDTNFKAAITSFERLFINTDLNSDAIDLDNLGFTSYVTLSGTETTASELRNVANGGTVVLGDVDAALTISVKDALATAADSVTIVNNSANNAADVIIEDVSTVNINSTVDAAVLDLDATATTTVVMQGAGSITLDAVFMDNLTKLDASLMTDALTFVADGAAAGTTVLGGEAADVLTTAGNGDTIVGNGGADRITVANGDNIKIIGGAAADVFTIAGSSSTDSVYAIFQAAEGDTTNVGVTDGDQFIFNSGVSGQADTFIAQKITLSLGATESTQAYIAKALENLNIDEMGWFQYGGNTFIVREGNTNDIGGYNAADGDQVVMIVGLVDLGTNATYNSTSNILEINL